MRCPESIVRPNNFPSPLREGEGEGEGVFASTAALTQTLSQRRGVSKASMHPRAATLIRLLDLAPHPEGGYYREVFRSARRVRARDAASDHAAITTIYFLLVAGQHSRWHRVVSDEIWHYYEGDPLELIWLDAARTVPERRRLGPASDECQPVQIVPGGCWQAARSLGGHTLVGCSVGPGFEFREFSLLADDPGELALVRGRFPELAVLI